MKVNEYYQKLNDETTKIFSQSLERTEIQSFVMDLKSNLNDWYKTTSKVESSNMLRNAVEELDISCLQLMQGLYRSAFASLRLCLEMVCASLYYSAHDIQYKEWLNGSQDLIWSQLTCSDNGIFSIRFSKAYFPEISDHLSSLSTKTKTLYRTLSEMVHGNSNTWNFEKPNLKFNELVRKDYLKFLNELAIIANFGYCLRYLNSLEHHQIDAVEHHIIDRLNTYNEIRKKIGGPADE